MADNRKENMNRKEYTIGEVCRIYNISLKTLHYYDDLGILKPNRRDEQSGYRYYDEDITLRMGSIKYYQSTGMSLKKIKEFLFSDDLDTLIHLFEEDLQKRENEMKNAVMQRDAMEIWNHLLIEGKMLLRRKELPLGIRQVKEIETVFVYNSGSMLMVATESEQVVFGAIYVEYPSLEKRMIGEPQTYIKHMQVHPLTSKHIRTATIGGFRAVSGIHIGPRDNIGTTYKKMLLWGRENSFVLGETSFERYIIDETSVNREREFVTEILIPIR